MAVPARTRRIPFPEPIFSLSPVPCRCRVPDGARSLSQFANATGRCFSFSCLFFPEPEAASAPQTGCSPMREEIAKQIIE